MKLVIMTKSTFFVEEDKILASLFDEGMDNLHLFKPGSSPMYSERLLTLLPKDFYKKITVHEHYYLNNEYRLGGTHIDNPADIAPQRFQGSAGAYMFRPEHVATDEEGKQLRLSEECLRLYGIPGREIQLQS